MIRRRLLAGFFLFMLGCTVASRIYDSVTVPKVTTSPARRKAVETRVEGTGTVKVKEKQFCRIRPGLRISRIEVIPGSEVKEGDPLFWYDMESVQERQEELQKETEQIMLAIEKEQISRTDWPGLTRTETARWELSLAERELEEGEREFQDILSDHEAELERLQAAYEDGLYRTEEELWRQQERDWESARQEVDTLRDSRDEAVREQQRKIEDLEEELDELPEEEESRREKLEKQLKRAREDLEAVSDSWEERVDTAKFQLDLLDRQEDLIRKGQTSVQEARRENYESAVKQEEERLKAARKELEAQRKAVERARWQLEAAGKEDDSSRKTRDQQKQISLLTVKGLELDKKEKEKEAAMLEALAEAGGRVNAPRAGVVVDMELEEGKTSTGQELLSLTWGGAWFEGTFLKEEQELVVGDRLQISIPGSGRSQEAVIGRMNLLGEAEGVFQADLEGGNIKLGAVTSYCCTRQSEIFEKVIPLSALRKDMKGYYCLVARPVSTILGEEFRAERVNVEVLFRGREEAAVDGPVFDTDKVITGENKAIGEGSRVRPVSGFQTGQR